MCLDCQENSSTLPLGPQGIQGINGINGTNGITWYTTSGIPSNTLGNNGDNYLDTNTFNIYNKQAGVWILVGNIKGTNSSGLYKLAITYITGTDSGTLVISLLGTFLSSYGLLGLSTPGSAIPPVGQSYGQTSTDFISTAYIFNSGTNTWNSIPSAQKVISTNASSGNISITLSGIPTNVPVRVILIG